jgi:alkylation response protein AidB-like acyl-CoA dehydrogenase
MDFCLNDDQRLLQEQLDIALSRVSPLARVRRHAGADGEFPGDVWAALTEFGLPGVLIPCEFGGLGMAVLDAALLSEVLGRHAVPVPFFGAAVAAPLAILGAGSKTQQAQLLPQIAAGKLRMAVAMSEILAGARGGGGVEVQGGKLYGTTHFAVDILGAHEILVADSAGGLHRVDADAPGLTVTPLVIVDRTHSAAALTFNSVTAERLEGATPGVSKRIAMALQVTAAADLLGAGTRMLEMAVEYAKVRRQFGRPIGSFQAVKHLCADMAAELEPGRALMWYAAHAQDVALPDAALAVLHAKAYLADAARIAARNSIEVHGGIGITDELGLHFWFKRVTFCGQLFGGSTRMRELAALEPR